MEALCRYSACIYVYDDLCTLSFVSLFLGFSKRHMKYRSILACTVSSANLNHMQPSPWWHLNDSTAYSVPWCLQITIDPSQALIVFFITKSHEHVITHERCVQTDAVHAQTSMQDEIIQIRDEWFFWPAARHQEAAGQERWCRVLIAVRSGTLRLARAIRMF